ncbi:MAG: TIGR00730 family Rossman fold protein [Bacteroidales bacterium]|nr:TIGR00730 family Rossman fold protein [Bacteroidales bacterium]
MRYNSLALYCGSSAGNNPNFRTLAADFGRRCAEKQLTLSYGGASIGLMAEASNAARAMGGRVVGIAPNFFSNRSVIDTSLEELILVDSMSERKQKLESLADGFVILPGSYGTMDEFFEMMTDAQLGLHSKPVAVVNAEGYYDHLIAQLERFRADGFLRSFHYDLLIVANDLDELFDKLDHYENSNDQEWLKHHINR